MLPNSIQEVIKEEAKVFFDKDPFYNTADAVRNGYNAGATKWADMLIELNKVYADYCGTDLLKTFFEQSKQKK